MQLFKSDFMKKCLLIVLILLLNNFVFPQEVEWAINGGGFNTERVQALTTDFAGNIYVSGGYFGPTTIGGQALPEFGNEDVFIAKYNSAGNFLWVRYFIEFLNNVYVLLIC